MGLIYNFLMAVIHLLFVGMDILITMLLIKAVYERWQPKWLKQINNTVDPLIVPVLAFVYGAVKQTTGKSSSEKSLVIVIALGMCTIRFIIDLLFGQG